MWPDNPLSINDFFQRIFEKIVLIFVYVWLG